MNYTFKTPPPAPTCGAVEFFKLPPPLEFTSTMQVKGICMSIIHQIESGELHVPSYLIECVKVIRAGATLKCVKGQLKQQLRTILGEYTKQHQIALVYAKGAVSVRDVEACAVWVWLINSIITVL